MKDNLDKLLEDAVLVTDDPYYSIIEEYIERFGHGVPTALIPKTITRKEICAALRECINSGNEDVLGYLNVSLRINGLY